MGPFRLIHDHATGRTTIWHGVDLARVVQGRPSGLTARAAAVALFEVEKPSPAQVEKARRRLDKLVESMRVEREDQPSGTVYLAVSDTLLRLA